MNLLSKMYRITKNGAGKCRVECLNMQANASLNDWVVISQTYDSEHEARAELKRLNDIEYANQRDNEFHPI